MKIIIFIFPLISFLTNDLTKINNIFENIFLIKDQQNNSSEKFIIKNRLNLLLKTIRRNAMLCNKTDYTFDECTLFVINKTLDWLYLKDFKRKDDEKKIRKLDIFDSIGDFFGDAIEWAFGEEFFKKLIEFKDALNDFLNTTILNITEIKETLESYSYNFSSTILQLGDTKVNLTEVYTDFTDTFTKKIKKCLIIFFCVVGIAILMSITGFLVKIKFLLKKSSIEIEKNNKNNLVND